MVAEGVGWRRSVTRGVCTHTTPSNSRSPPAASYGSVRPFPKNRWKRVVGMCSGGYRAWWCGGELVVRLVNRFSVSLRHHPVSQRPLLSAPDRFLFPLRIPSPRPPGVSTARFGGALNCVGVNVVVCDPSLLHCDYSHCHTNNLSHSSTPSSILPSPPPPANPSMHSFKHHSGWRCPARCTEWGSSRCAPPVVVASIRIDSRIRVSLSRF